MNFIMFNIGIIAKVSVTHISNVNLSNYLKLYWNPGIERRRNHLSYYRHKEDRVTLNLEL